MVVLLIIYHRDIKPSNIIVDKQDRAILIDFEMPESLLLVKQTI